jgi:hypothetical protein
MCTAKPLKRVRILILQLKMAITDPDCRSLTLFTFKHKEKLRLFDIQDLGGTSYRVKWDRISLQRCHVIPSQEVGDDFIRKLENNKYGECGGKF